jgi:hypothetical protein
LWVETQFERAWAHFRIDDINGSLSLLKTHSSPWMQGEYYPEAAMLEVYSLFMLCKFPAASALITDFQTRFTPQSEELASLTRLSSRELWDRLGSEDPGLPHAIEQEFVGEARFAAAQALVVHLDREISKLSTQSAPWAQTAKRWLTEHRDQIITEEGSRAAALISQMDQELSEMLANTEMNKLDIIQLEGRLYENAANTGEMDKAKNLVSRGLKVREGYRYWPFEGELWADEVGWYKIRTKPECPASLRKK